MSSLAQLASSMDFETTQTPLNILELSYLGHGKSEVEVSVSYVPLSKKYNMRCSESCLNTTSYGHHPLPPVIVLRRTPGSDVWRSRCWAADLQRRHPTRSSKIAGFIRTRTSNSLPARSPRAYAVTSQFWSPQSLSYPIRELLLLSLPELGTISISSSSAAQSTTQSHCAFAYFVHRYTATD